MTASTNAAALAARAVAAGAAAMADGENDTEES
jgi:hypothetical protein